MRPCVREFRDDQRDHRAGFAAGRAKALGIALNGTALGGVLLLPLLTFGGRTFGWVWTIAILGAAAIVILTWMSAVLNSAGQQNGLTPSRVRLVRR